VVSVHCGEMLAGKGNCIIDKARRNWCPFCRLQRCFAARMNVAGKFNKIN